MQKNAWVNFRRLWQNLNKGPKILLNFYKSIDYVPQYCVYLINDEKGLLPLDDIFIEIVARRHLRFSRIVGGFQR